jgi:transcriptional regulator with XRE-family HTH domain
LVGRSESWLSQVERSLRQIDSHSVLMSLAEVLRVDVAELTGDEPAEQRAAQYTAAQEIERAMMAYDGLESVIGGDEAERSPDVARLLLGLGRVNRAYQAARYDEAGRMLPALIRGAALLIAVKDDGSDKIPLPSSADALAEDGRGLALVGLIASRWGHCSDQHGRTVWFELRWNGLNRSDPWHGCMAKVVDGLTSRPIAGLRGS